jgi:hypothetical protein
MFRDGRGLTDQTILPGAHHAGKPVAGFHRAFAREVGIMHAAVNLRAGIRVNGAVHVQNVNAYHSSLRGWLSVFHGVATRYLPNYLGWRWILDARRIGSPESLLKAALGAFTHFVPHLTVT